MTIDLHSNSGLALNQNILLAELYDIQQSREHYPHAESYYEKLRHRTVSTDKYKLTKKQYIRARAGLINRGYLERRDNWLTEKGIEAVKNYNYITSGPMRAQTGIRNPPPKTLGSYIWAALRAKNIATVEELLHLAPIETDDYKISYDTARRFLNWLCKLGIVRRLPRKQRGLHLTSPGFNRYQLMLDLGPRHPIIRQRKRQLYDPNSQINVHFKEVLKVFTDRLHRYR